MQLVVVVSSFNLALTFNGHISFLLIVYFSIITLNKGNVGTHHLNNRILLFVCNRKVIYYYYITLPSITITITLGIFNLLLLLLQENRFHDICSQDKCSQDICSQDICSQH